MSLVRTSSRVDQPYLAITMSRHSHEVEIELFNNSSDDDAQSLNERDGLIEHDDSSFSEEASTPPLDTPDEFVSCSESLSSQHSLEHDRSHDTPSLWEATGKPVPILHRRVNSSTSSSSIDGSSIATLRSRAKSRELRTQASKLEESQELKVNELLA